LTGLANRALFDQSLEHAAQRATRGHTSAAVLFADLDRFKAVNDTYGHQAGDHLLIAVADRLRAILRPGDTLARVSGDEFVFLCEDLAHITDAEILVNRIRSAFVSPFQLDTAEVTITASVGVAFAGPGEEISGHLVVNADTAMYQAKRASARRQERLVDLRDQPNLDATRAPKFA
jgi:diguanylate cyclase (GGDEF)-like protein